MCCLLKLYVNVNYSTLCYGIHTVLLQSLSLSEVSNVGEKYLYLAPEEPDEAEPSLESAISLPSTGSSTVVLSTSYCGTTNAEPPRRARLRELATAVCLVGCLVGTHAVHVQQQSSMVFLVISTPLLLPSP